MDITQESLKNTYTIFDEDIHSPDPLSSSSELAEERVEDSRISRSSSIGDRMGLELFSAPISTVHVDLSCRISSPSVTRLTPHSQFLTKNVDISNLL